MDIVHVAAWIVVIFFGLALLKGLLGEPLYSYVMVGAAGLGIIGLMALLALAFWDPIGRSLTIMLGITMLGMALCVMFGYIGQLVKALYRLLRNRFTGSGSPNTAFLR